MFSSTSFPTFDRLKPAKAVARRPICGVCFFRPIGSPSVLLFPPPRLVAIIINCMAQHVLPNCVLTRVLHDSSCLSVSDLVVVNCSVSLFPPRGGKWFLACKPSLCRLCISVLLWCVLQISDWLSCSFASSIFVSAPRFFMHPQVLRFLKPILLFSTPLNKLIALFTLSITHMVSKLQSTFIILHLSRIKVLLRSRPKLATDRSYTVKGCLLTHTSIVK